MFGLAPVWGAVNAPLYPLPCEIWLGMYQAQNQPVLIVSVDQSDSDTTDFGAVVDPCRGIVGYP
jgi:hypothetical protein